MAATWRRALGCSKGAVPRCQTSWAGPLPPIKKQRPLIVRYAWQLSILHDFEDDRISRYIGNETRLLSFMSALGVNSGTAKQKAAGICALRLAGFEN
jgi:hypothetical protein